MSVEWASRQVARRMAGEHTAVVDGFALKVTDEGWESGGVHWSVQGYVDDFHLDAYGWSSKTVEEAQAAAIAAAHRLLELGARGRP